MWSDDRNRLLTGRVAILVYCHYNQRVLDRTYGNWASVDWDSFVDSLEQEDPIKAPVGHAALAVPGALSLHLSCHASQHGQEVICNIAVNLVHMQALSWSPRMRRRARGWTVSRRMSSPPMRRLPHALQRRLCRR